MNPTTWNLTETFEANGKTWNTDLETLQVLRTFRAKGDMETLTSLCALAAKAGRITEK